MKELEKKSRKHKIKRKLKKDESNRKRKPGNTIKRKRRMRKKENLETHYLRETKEGRKD